MAHVEDRWTRRDPDNPRKRLRTARWGAGRRWLAVWEEGDGTRRKKAFDTKDEADAHLSKVDVDRRSGTYISVARNLTPLRVVAEAWYAEQLHLRSSTSDLVRRRLDRTILPSLGDRPIGQIQRADVQAAVGGWKLGPQTVAVAYSYLVAVCRYAVTERYITASPCRDINLPAKPGGRVVPLPVDVVQALTEQADERYQPMFVLAAASGLRPSELMGLTWDRVEDGDGGALLRIDRQLDRSSSARTARFGPLKTEWSQRTVAIGPATRDALGRRGKGLLFTRPTGGPIVSYYAASIWTDAARGLPIPPRTSWHALRHFHASLLIAAGSSPVAVAHRLGHKDARETLRTYAHLWVDDDERMRRAADGVIAPRQPPAS